MSDSPLRYPSPAAMEADARNLAWFLHCRKLGYRASVGSSGKLRPGRHRGPSNMSVCHSNVKWSVIQGGVTLTAGPPAGWVPPTEATFSLDEIPDAGDSSTEDDDSCSEEGSDSWDGDGDSDDTGEDENDDTGEDEEGLGDDESKSGVPLLAECPHY